MRNDKHFFSYFILLVSSGILGCVCYVCRTLVLDGENLSCGRVAWFSSVSSEKRVVGKEEIASSSSLAIGVEWNKLYIRYNCACIFRTRLFSCEPFVSMYLPL